MEYTNDHNYCAQETYPDNFSKPVTVEFDFSQTGILSPMLFGDNMEHTRDCIQSGISAQMLKNRKFAALPDHSSCGLFWEAIGKNAAFAYKEPYTRHGDGYKMRRIHESHSQVITNYGPFPAVQNTGAFS